MSSFPRHRSALPARAILFAPALALAFACHSQGHEPSTSPPDAAIVAVTRTTSASKLSPLEATLQKQRLTNTVAYIPPQCFTKTRLSDAEPAKNPCYVCHADAPAPNFAADSSFQLLYAFPSAAADNPWTNLFAPPVASVPRELDDDVLRDVRRSNYVTGGAGIVLANALRALPPDWDIDGNGTWGGYVPDAWLSFDDRGFDHDPKGDLTGWRAFAYYPFPGTFFPTNGSTDDVLVRLDPRLQEDTNGHFDLRTYVLNFAIVEALITRRNVAVDPVDESRFGLDVDLDGRIAWADHVTFDAASPDGEGTRMRYAGRAGAEQRAGSFPIAPGLFPLGTEFFHTVRYLDLGPDGAARMAARMKEVRYAKKVSYLGYDALRGRANADAREQLVSRDGSRRVNWQGERGIDNGQGWTLQGFIEDDAGALRPQTREETVYCAGCHGGIGATSDSIFSFARKLDAGQTARGWFHGSQHDLHGVPEPRRMDGKYEYTTYLQQAGAGDELRENREVIDRFFDERGHLRPDEIQALHEDVTRLLLPSRERALDLDRAYLAIVETQSFARGRDAILAPSKNVHAQAPIGEPTGVGTPVGFAPLARR